VDRRLLLATCAAPAIVDVAASEPTPPAPGVPPDGERDRRAQASDQPPKGRRQQGAPPQPTAPPIAYSVEGAVAASGLSRSRLYALASEGRLTFRRAGKRSVIMADELAALLRSLPPAPIRQSKRDAA
jgi:hypothetical protein